MSSKYTIVTSFNKALWKAYGKKIFKSWIDNIDPSIPLVLYIDTTEELEGFRDMVESEGYLDRIELRSLEDTSFVEFDKKYGQGQAFVEKGIDMAKVPPGHQFRFNYLPFAKKVYAWTDYIQSDFAHFSFEDYPCSSYYIWFDFDLLIKDKITKADLDNWFGDYDVTYLNRDYPWYAAETGVFSICLNNFVDAIDFVDDIEKTYSSGLLFDFSEWHDGYIFKVLLKKYYDALRIKNLNEYPKERDVLGKSLLGKKIKHLKGDLKFKIDEEKTVINITTSSLDIMEESILNLNELDENLISKDYLKMNHKLHTQNQMYGVKGAKDNLEKVRDFVLSVLPEDIKILDYGTGKGSMVEALERNGYDITGYDPANPKYNQHPKGSMFDAILCMDVLEHVEPDKIHNVLRDIKDLGKSEAVYYFSVFCGPSKKTLADGRNSHLIQENSDWWEALFKEHGFNIKTVIEVPAEDKKEYTIVAERI